MGTVVLSAQGTHDDVTDKSGCRVGGLPTAIDSCSSPCEAATGGTGERYPLDDRKQGASRVFYRVAVHVGE